MIRVLSLRNESWFALANVCGGAENAGVLNKCSGC